MLFVSFTSPYRTATAWMTFATTGAIAVIAFGAGRLTSDPADWTQPAQAEASAPPVEAQGVEAPRFERQAAPPTPTPALVARVTGDAQSIYEAARPELSRRCMPTYGLPDGQVSAKLAFDIVYDAGGREISRRVIEERPRQTGDLARCLRRMPLGALHVQPPGTNVNVQVALDFP
jgi:hypothetical protein